MAMSKTGKAHMPCRYCGNDAIEDSDPPVCPECARRKMTKRAAGRQEDPKTLKELDSADGKKKQ